MTRKTDVVNLFLQVSILVCASYIFHMHPQIIENIFCSSKGI